MLTVSDNDTPTGSLTRDRITLRAIFCVSLLLLNGLSPISLPPVIRASFFPSQKRLSFIAFRSSLEIRARDSHRTPRSIARSTRFFRLGVALVNKGIHTTSNIHVITRKLTQSIERTNLTLSARLKRLTRRTICFSRLEKLYDKVTGKSISRMWYQPI